MEQWRVDSDRSAGPQLATIDWLLSGFLCKTHANRTTREATTTRISLETNLEDILSSLRKM